LEIKKKASMRIGIYGGTFDPPHIAHLILAGEASFQLNLGRILWLLTPVSPLKNDHSISPWQQRLELLNAAIDGNPAFELTRVDIDRTGPHYAFESMHILRRMYENDKLFYLMGEDSLRDLPHWERPDLLLDACSSLGVMRRPGTMLDLKNLEQKIPGLKAKLCWIDAPLLEISGKLIRKRILHAQPFRYFLPERVYQLIIENGYYEFGGENKKG
jgi:nicotinate-nucleotide adenylyltransferase